MLQQWKSSHGLICQGNYSYQKFVTKNAFLKLKRITDQSIFHNFIDRKTFQNFLEQIST